MKHTGIVIQALCVAVTAGMVAISRTPITIASLVFCSAMFVVVAIQQIKK